MASSFSPVFSQNAINKNSSSLSSLSSTAAVAAAVTASCPLPSTSLPGSFRSTTVVQSQVALAWKERRLTKGTHDTSKPNRRSPDVATQAVTTVASTTQPTKSCTQPTTTSSSDSLCVLVQKTWEEWNKHKPVTHHRPDHHNGTHSKHKRQHSQVFPSLLSILQTNALLQQRNECQGDNLDNDDEERDQGSQGTRETVIGSDSDTERSFSPTSSAASSRCSSPVNLFDEHVPANVTTWLAPCATRTAPVTVTAAHRHGGPAGLDWTRAIREMAQSRSRAFLLLDMTALLRRLVAWKQRLHRLGLLAHGKFVFWHAVQANADPKLLQVLLQSGIVALATTTRADLQRAVPVVDTMATNTNTNSRDHLLLDSTSTLTLPTQAGGKPDAYLRELVWTARVSTIVVDGPDEVRRVMTSLSRMAARRATRQDQPNGVIKFMLKLSDTKDDWNETVKTTFEAIQEFNHQTAASTSSLSPTCILDGLSFFIGHAAAGNDPATQRRQAAIESLVQWIHDQPNHTHHSLRIDLTGWKGSQEPLSLLVDGNVAPGNSSMLNQSVNDQPPTEWLYWGRDLLAMTRPPINGDASQRRVLVRQITMEATCALVAPIGALCTRLIGVKTATTTLPETGETVVKRHYYIDDGCYGSLYNGGLGTSYQPLPLRPHDTTMGASDLAGPVHLSTVWGPTCDGLDRVCQDIPLPDLKRDDWLVFPNQGACASEGLGTAFNGFSPPDTAYCVLGYSK